MSTLENTVSRKIIERHHCPKGLTTATLLGGIVGAGLFGLTGGIGILAMGAWGVLKSIEQGDRLLAELEAGELDLTPYLDDPRDRALYALEQPAIDATAAPVEDVQSETTMPPETSSGVTAPNVAETWLDRAKSAVSVRKTQSAAPTSDSPIAERLAWLEQRLEQDGAAVLLRLVSATPLRVIGPQRSGKTTFVKTLALLRMLYLEGHSVEAWSPDDETKDGGQWPQCFELYGLKDGKPDYRSIAQRMTAMGARVDAGQRGNRTLVMDEFGSYGLSGIDHDLIKETVKVSMMRGAKNGELAVLILHGHTAEFLGQVTGLQGMLSGYRTIWLTTKEDKLGKASPGDTFKLTRGEECQTIPRPKWLTPDFLLGLFPELTPTAPVPTPAPPTATPAADPLPQPPDNPAAPLPPNVVQFAPRSTAPNPPAPTASPSPSAAPEPRRSRLRRG